jgi:cytoskeletal protein RodZ
MASIGETLRRERLRRSWDLEKVSKETKISTRLLEAIEADQFDHLPGGVFTRNFIRQYARAIGLDEQEINSELTQLRLNEPPVVPPDPSAPGAESHHVGTSPLSEIQERLQPDTSLTSFVLMVLVVLACAGIYILWQHGRGSPGVAASAAVNSLAPPARVARPAASPTIQKPAGPPRSTETTQNNERNRATAIQSNTAQGSVPPAADGIHVVIAASEPAWVSASSEGERLYIGTLEANKSKQLHAPSNMKIVLGNAGGVHVVMNGVSLGELGPRSQVRILQLTPTGYTVVPRTPPSPTAEPAPAPSTAAAPR